MAAAGTAPIPVPETADDVEFDGALGKIEFRSASSVAALAAFYRTEMAPLGWKERPSVINRPNMVVLSFVKDSKTLSFTIMQMGPKVNVSANGGGLVTETAQRNRSSDVKVANAPAAIQQLETDETSGMPVPKESTMKGSEKTPFRLVINANVPANVAVGRGVLPPRTGHAVLEGGRACGRRQFRSGEAGVHRARRAGRAQAHPQGRRDDRAAFAPQACRGEPRPA